MNKQKAVLITNIPVPYRYELYKSFCNDAHFEGWVFFDSLTYGETWATSMDAKVNYEVLGGKTIGSETGRIPVNLRLIRKLFRQSPDVVVLSEFSPLLVIQTLFYRFFSLKKVKLVSMTDENHGLYRNLSYKIIRLLFRKLVLRFSDSCICCSEGSRRHIEQISSKIKGKTIVSYLTPEAFFYHHSGLGQEGNTPAVNILMVCRLVALKRVDRLLQAAKWLKEHRSDLNWHISIVGDGPEKQKLMNIVYDHGLENQIIFKGRLVGERLHEMYQRSNIFVLTSYKEVWGVVIHEAMLNGVVPIVTKAVGASELVEKAGGLVIDDEEVEESLIIEGIARALEVLISNPILLREKQTSCLDLAANYTIETELHAFLSAVY